MCNCHNVLTGCDGCNREKGGEVVECTSPSSWSPLMLNSATNFRLSGEVPLSPLQGVPSSGFLSRRLCLVRGSISSSMYVHTKTALPHTITPTCTYTHIYSGLNSPNNEWASVDISVDATDTLASNRNLLSSVLPTTGRGRGTVPLHCRGGVAIEVLQARASGTSSSLTDYKQTQQSLQSTCYNWDHTVHTHAWTGCAFQCMWTLVCSGLQVQECSLPVIVHHVRITSHTIQTHFSYVARCLDRFHVLLHVCYVHTYPHKAHPIQMRKSH